MERTAYGRTNASLTRLRGSAQRPTEGKGLDRGFSLRQNLTPNRTARLVISGGSIVTPGATSIMVNPKRKKNAESRVYVCMYNWYPTVHGVTSRVQTHEPDSTRSQVATCGADNNRTLGLLHNVTDKTVTKVTHNIMLFWEAGRWGSCS